MRLEFLIRVLVLLVDVDVDVDVCSGGGASWRMFASPMASRCVRFHPCSISGSVRNILKMTPRTVYNHSDVNC